jgi:hypothetical protein
MQKPELLNTGDAAAYLGISRGTLEHWRTESPPKGPAYIRLGFQVRYRTADLVAWIERNVVMPRMGGDDE